MTGLIGAVEAWARTCVDESVTVVSAGWEDRTDFGAPWVSVGIPEGEFEPVQFGGGERRWETTWTVRVYVGPGSAFHDPGEAWVAAWVTVRRLIDGAAGKVAPIDGVWWVDPAACVVDEDYSEAVGSLVLGLDLRIMTVGWKDI